jgi:hypothetical protein
VSLKPFRGIPVLPSARLDNHPIQIQPYDVLGQDSESQDHKYFVSHVGLATEAIIIDRIGQTCEVVHMRPPLELKGQMQPQVHGTANLSADEIEQIESFHRERKYQYEAEQKRDSAQFYIHPAILPVRSPKGRIKYYRYSCAGFVFASYQAAGIELLGSSNLPDVDLSILVSAYPDQSGRLQNRNKRERLGLEGDGPWPVLLCGYLFHSLNRDTDEIRDFPYEPSPGDEIFPRLP